MILIPYSLKKGKLLFTKIPKDVRGPRFAHKSDEMQRAHPAPFTVLALATKITILMRSNNLIYTLYSLKHRKIVVYKNP